MSSPAPTASPSSPPDDTDGVEGSGAGAQHGANYFFGFLITFVGLLIIFIIFGILGSRRRLAARREAALNGTFESLRRFPNGKPEPPQLYEHLFVIGEDKWNSIMPLSVRFCREEKEEESSVTHGLQVLPPATPTGRGTRSNSTGYIPSLNSLNRLPTHHFNPSLQTTTETDPDPPETIQVAVMIAMPSRDLSPRTNNRSKSPDRLREYQIGNVNLPWRQRDLHPDS